MRTLQHLLCSGWVCPFINDVWHVRRSETTSPLQQYRKIEALIWSFFNKNQADDEDKLRKENEKRWMEFNKFDASIHLIQATFHIQSLENCGNLEISFCLWQLNCNSMKGRKNRKSCNEDVKEKLTEMKRYLFRFLFICSAFSFTTTCFSSFKVGLRECRIFGIDFWVLFVPILFINIFPSSLNQ